MGLVRFNGVGKSPDVPPKKISSVITGAAGEHFVLYQLYRRGFLAGMPPTGTPDVDLLVLDEVAKVVTNLQVKTRTKGADGGWHMKSKHETLVSSRLFYVFVDFESDNPICYIIPSKTVADAVRIAHKTWLDSPGKGGRRHNPTDMRRIVPIYTFPVRGFEPGWMDKYKERWDLLQTD